MIEWFEMMLERGTQRAKMAIVMRLHPELHQIKHEHDRAWAVWFATEDEPDWQRYLLRAIVFVGGPSLVTLLVFLLAQQFDPRWRTYWPVLFVAGWMFGLVCSVLIVIASRHRHDRRRYFLAMRIFGQDVCPDCGYDMEGHSASVGVDRCCPECGSQVATPAR